MEKKLKVFYAFIFLFLSFLDTLPAQKQWTLEDCLKYARDHNLQIESADIDASMRTLDVKESAQARYPNINGTSSFSYNFGRNIDPTTNDFVPQNLGFNSINLNTNVLLYNGGRLREQYARTILTQKEFEARKQQTLQDIELEITLAYLNILFESERKRNAEDQLNISQNQLDQVEKRIAIEVVPESDKYEWVAQAAQDEQQIILSENAIENGIFQLKNLLNLDTSDPFDIVFPDTTLQAIIDLTDYDFQTVYNQVLKVRPEIEAFSLSEQAAEKEISIARSSFVPTLLFGAALTTNYSTLAQTFEDFNSVRIPTDGVFINGEPVAFEQNKTIPGNTFRTPYFDQLNQNLGIGFGVQLNIPIYDRSDRRINLHRAEYDLKLIRNANLQRLKSLELQIQQVLADLKGAQKQYFAGLRRVEYLQNAHQNLNKRFSLGMSNSYDLLDAQNRLNQGITDLTIAKYNLIFRKQVLDFYLGKPMKI